MLAYIDNALAAADEVIRHVNAAIEPFDVQSAGRPVFGLDTGRFGVLTPRSRSAAPEGPLLW